MPATRDGKTWRSQFYYEDWQGIRHKKNKRGFKTKAEAEEWERNFRQQQRKDLDINFENFVEIYFTDMENRLRESTIKNKRYKTGKRQLQLVDGIMKEDLYTAYYSVSENEEIVADRDVEIPGMEEDMLVERIAEVVVEPDISVTGMKSDNNQNEIGVQKEQTDSARKQHTDLEGIGISEIQNSSDMNVSRIDESITDVTGKSKLVETRETEPVDKAGWIVRKISELGGYENVSDSVKADIFGFDIADVSGSIRLFLDVMKRLGIKMDGAELYEEFQRIYDEAVSREADKEKVVNEREDKRCRKEQDAVHLF